MRVSARALVFGSVGMILATATAAFAQDPNAYPPQQYPQQQYPQQQYPQQQYPQQQYPQQQYPQQYPPAGYAAPAPAAPPSYQQPGYAPPPAVPAYTDLRHGGLMILNLGLNIPVGSGSDGYSAGLSLGGLFGGHINHDISLNGELSIYAMNHDQASSDDSEAIVDFAFSPLYHVGQGNIEFVFGPKLGAFGYSLTNSNTDDKMTASGLAYGFNAGMFFQLSNSLAFGGLLNFTGHHASSVCVTYNGSESCGDAEGGDDIKLLTLNAGLRW